MVNVVNVNKVIEKIRDENNFFSMVDFYIDPAAWEKDSLEDYLGTKPPSCATPACIGGWTEHIMMKESGNELDYITLDQSYEWLGLDTKDENDYSLFYPSHKTFQDITRSEAIEVLSRLKDTGKVIWK